MHPPEPVKCFNLRGMVKQSVQPGKNCFKPQTALGLLLSTCWFCAGCASPGPPKPPSLHLPQVVNDLSAERSGDQVLLRWTTPSRTTDEMDVQGPMTAQICRETDVRPSTPGARLAVCQPVRRITVVPGPSEVTETLPPSLQADPVRLIAYRIQILNSAGRSAGDSAVPAYAAAGQAPPDVAGLQARAAEPGAVLEWQSGAARKPGAADLIDLKRVDISTPAPERRAKPAPAASSGAASGPHPRKSKPRAAQPKPAAEDPPNEVHLRTPETLARAQPDTGGTVDTTAQMGDTYTYVAKRVRQVTLGSRQLEIASSPSPAVTLEMRDTFPPKPPTGLETIAGSSTPDTAVAGAKHQPYIDLSWEPNGEPDLAGYRVYRQLARPDGSPQGPLARLTALPISVPAYRDVAVTPGQGYIYSVTAVDAAGNESAPSAKALEVVSGLVPEVVSPEAGQPPH
jgi:hypothetical protein